MSRTQANTHTHTNIALRVTHALNYRKKENKQELPNRKQKRIWDSDRELESKSKWESKSESESELEPESGLTSWTCRRCHLAAYPSDGALSSDLFCVQSSNLFPRNCKEMEGREKRKMYKKQVFCFPALKWTQRLKFSLLPSIFNWLISAT